MSNPAGARFGGPRRHTARVDLEALAQLSGRITAMEPQRQDPKRRSVHVDGVFVVGLHEETIILAGLRVGRQVDGPALVEAVRRDEARRAWDYALLLLSATARSCREVERRLNRKYPAEVAAAVVERLVNGGWLDDAEFARAYVRSHADYGERRLLTDLARRGVPAAVARPVVAELTGDVDAVEQAREAAAARLKRMDGVDRDAAQRRLASQLARRGYDFETISRALAPLLADLPRAPRPPAGARRSSLSRSRWPRREEE